MVVIPDRAEYGIVVSAEPPPACSFKNVCEGCSAPQLCSGLHLLVLCARRELCLFKVTVKWGVGEVTFIYL